MKKYNLALASRLTAVVLTAIALGVVVALFYDSTYLFFFIFFITFILYIFISRLYRFLQRTRRDTERLINAIRFSESNITFQRFRNQGLSPELALQMETALTAFNKKRWQTEADQQFYDNLLNRIDSGIMVINKANEIEWVNKAALDEFGKPQPRKLADLKAVSSDLPQLLETIVPKETKVIRIQKEDGFRQLAISAVMFSSKGKDLKLVSIKNIESVIEESESDAWKKLIRVLTHEMMNSITPIISLSESFSENGEENDEERNKLMERAMHTIHRRSKGLVDFVQNYQKLTRIPPPEIAPVPAKEIMDDIIGLFSADGIFFSSSIDPADMIWKVDRPQIEQVLINLIKNAWEACADCSDPKVTVTVTANAYRQPIISITDNGEGILPEVLDKIFVPFFTTKQGGSGIGLSICRQIINAHGGTISGVSESGKGSSFTIKL